MQYYVLYMRSIPLNNAQDLNNGGYHITIISAVNTQKSVPAV